MGLLDATVVLAQSEGAPAESADAVSDESDTQAVAPPERLYDLGEFHVQEVRSTSNETADVRFSLHLVLGDEVSDRVYEGLLEWRHRLRDQVITVVRLTETAEFAEPQLEMMQKLIRRRLNRLLPALQVKDLYLTEFTANEP
jgi:flagellar basal body-associated protein FliL